MRVGSRIKAGIGIAVLASNLLSCAGIRTFFALNGNTEVGDPPINNPFNTYTTNGDASQNMIIRTKKGDRALELELPRSSQEMSEFAVPVGAAFNEKEAVKAEVNDFENDGIYRPALGHVKSLFKKGRYEVALLETEKMLKRYPTDPKLHQMRGTLLDRIGQSEMALRSWGEALHLDPKNSILKKFVEQRRLRRSIASP